MAEPGSSVAEPIGLDRVVAEELALVGRRKASGRPVERREPLRIAPRELGHRPIAAVENAIRAEAVDHMVDVRPELIAGPALMVGLGGDAGEFADDVGQRRHFTQLLTPWVEDASLDPGLADVI